MPHSARTEGYSTRHPVRSRFPTLGHLFVRSGLTAFDFALLNADGSGWDNTEHPDFSVFGAPIAFGYGYSNTPSGDTFTIDHGTDNWAVSLNVVPEPASGLLMISGAVLLSIRRRPGSSR